MTDVYNIAGALFAADVFNGKAVAARNKGKYFFACDTLAAAGGKKVLEHIGGHCLGNRLAGDEALRAQPLECALDLTDVVGDVFRQVGDDLVVQPDTQQLGFHLENGSAQLGVRRLDVGHQAAFKAGLQARFQIADVARRPVGGKYDLLSFVIKRVEGMEEFLLHRVFAGNEMHVVD